MITCKECRERLYPDDPNIPTGKYRHSTCNYFCDKPTYFREAEQIKSEIQLDPKPHPIKIEREIDQLKGRFIYLQNKLNRHLDKKRKSDFL